LLGNLQWRALLRYQGRQTGLGGGLAGAAGADTALHRGGIGSILIGRVGAAAGAIASILSAKNLHHHLAHGLLQRPVQVGHP
jgi:hypothetical protein